MSTITATGLVKRYGAITAVDDLSFSLTPGVVTGFLGANGAGKSTTLRLLLGLNRATAGSALINGQAYHQLAQPTRVVGALLEANTAHPNRSARNHLRMLARFAGLPQSRVERVLDEVGLTDAAKQRVGGFSLGMRQRLALAAALLGDPEILIMDEPTNGLDPEGVRWLRGLIRQYAAQGKTVLLSSHHLHELATVVDEVLVIAKGRLVAHEAVAPGSDLEARYLQLTSPSTARDESGATQ